MHLGETPGIFAGNAVGRLSKLPAGDAGVKVTLKKMARQARRASKNPKIRELALKIVRGPGRVFTCRVKDYHCESERLYYWVKKNIRWTKDTDGVETLQTPERTLEWRAGDCDDLSTLLAALALSIGIPCQYRVVAADPGSPKRFSHVYVLMYTGIWEPADPSATHEPFGWETDRATRVMDWPI